MRHLPMNSVGIFPEHSNASNPFPPWVMFDECKRCSSRVVSKPVLSAREREIAELAARGEINRAIASQLNLSVKAVEKHLATIYKKLGITRRAQLGSRLSPHQSSETPHGALPAPLTPFLGRAVEAEQLEQRLEDHRLLTLVGPGGSGKTRLALEVARRKREAFQNGAWWIDLSPLHDAAGVYPTLAAALDVTHDARTIRDAVLASLETREALLVLDNCEQLMPAVAHVVREVLERASRLRILVTSRQRLGVFGESVLRVGEMDLPDAMRFFRERAQAADAALPDQAGVEALCRRLDCIPLAMELAAARLHDTTFAELVLAVEDAASASLQTEDLGIEPRHRSVDAAVWSSYERLSEPEQGVFRALSTFADSFSEEAASWMHGKDGVRALEVLQCRSLIERLPSGRLRMLQVIRDVAQRLLRNAGEERRAFERLIAYYVQLLEDANHQWFTAPIERWLRPLRPETQNILLTMKWALLDKHALDDGVLLAAFAARLWSEIGREQEYEPYLEAALCNEALAPNKIRSRLWLTRSRNSDVAGDAGQALAAALRALELAKGEGNIGDDVDEEQAQLAVGCSYTSMGESSAAYPYLVRAKTFFQSRSLLRPAAAALTAIAIGLDDDERRAAVFLEVLEIARTLENRLLEGIVLSNLSETYRHLQRTSEALVCARDSVAFLHDIGAQARLARAQLNLAACEEVDGNLGAATSAALGAFRTVMEGVLSRQLQDAAERLALYNRLTHPNYAAKICAFSERVAQQLGAPHRNQALRDALQEQLGKDLCNALFETGSRADARSLYEEGRALEPVEQTPAKKPTALR